MKHSGRQQSSSSRREFLGITLKTLSISAGAWLMPHNKATASEPVQSSNSTKTGNQKDFIAKAFEMKRVAVDTGDQSYGAVVVKNGEIVGFGPSRVVVNQDPTAHAEIEAIRDACRSLKTNDLSGCELYSTSKPCRMCETAGYWANISNYYYRADIVDGGRPNYSSC